MRRIRFVALALIGCLTPYIFPNNEAYAQQFRQRELNGVWASTGDGFRGNDQGCHKVSLHSWDAIAPETTMRSLSYNCKYLPIGYQI